MQGAGGRPGVILSPQIPGFEITPHKDAPMYDGPDGPRILGQVANELRTGRFPVNDAFRDVFRQTCLVNLWMFLKHVAGYAQAFDLLNDRLHLDMCNFRQRLLKPGCRGAMFIPRSHYKSTIVTEGGTAWELTRNPALRVRISNAIADRAADFHATVKSIIDENAIYGWLFPDHVPRKGQIDWNRVTLVMRNRGRKNREPSLTYGGVGGASEGVHVDLHIVDDPIGLQALNADRRGNAVMTDTRNWFWSSEKSLLQGKNSRVIVVGTRYAIDDLYAEIISRAHVLYGHDMRNFEPNPKGSWEIYYRKAEEYGEVIFPENFTHEMFVEMAEVDWWTYVTQYLNDPSDAGLAELSQYDLPTFRMSKDANNDEWFIVETVEGGELVRPLSGFDVIQAIDPAATETYVSAKTSRSAVVVMACDSRGHKYIIGLKANYVEATTMFDWAFEHGDKFKKWLRATFLEANAGFKVLGPIMKQEEGRRGIWLGLRPFPSVGDKIAKIRSTLQPELQAGRLHVHETFYDLFREEQRSFPQGNRMDILDATQMAVSNVIRPPGEMEVAMEEDDDEWFRKSRNPVTGY